MKRAFPACFAMVLVAATSVDAHRLDEYLQATIISVQKNRIEAQINLVPGVLVFPIVFSQIDTDADGMISAAEESAYVQRVLHDLSLSVDGMRLSLQLMSATFAKKELLQEGLGEIQIKFDADVPRGRSTRTLTFENHHESRIGAYLVNSLVPRDQHIRVTSQNRNYEQSFFQLDYTDAAGRPDLLSSTSWSALLAWLGTTVIILLAAFALVGRRGTLANTPVTQK